MTPDLLEALKSGVAELGLDLSGAQTGQLMDYLALIQKWNKVYNLTAVRDPVEMLTHHLLDSLAVVRPLRQRLQGRVPADGQGWRLLDVGAGAGLPGVIIAICCPDIAVSCVDAVAKKATFIQQAALALKLTNLKGLHARVENLADHYDVVSSRAFASLADFTHGSREALAPGGIWLAMKGKHPADELAALPADVAVFHVEPLTVPGLDAERCIVWLGLAAT
ncbi:MAG: 16S rRNA (guanine(527)-N(7))-methyltransferase RsmG [Curvibacter sp.]